MAKLHIHPVGLVLILLGLIFWVIAMAGMAASTKFCKDNNQDAYSCAQAYQQDWWAIFFELFLLLTMLFTSFLNIFPKARYVYLSYLCMVTALLTFTTKKMYTKSFNQGVYTLDLDSKAYDAAGVGAMLLCMANFGLIVFIGLGAAKALEEEQGGGAAGANGNAAAYGGGSVAFTSVSTQGPPTGMGNTGMPAQTDSLMPRQMPGVPPAAPASF